MSGRIDVAKQFDFPGSAGLRHEGRPLGGLSCFWASVILVRAPLATPRTAALIQNLGGGVQSLSNVGDVGRGYVATLNGEATRFVARFFDQALALVTRLSSSCCRHLL